MPEQPERAVSSASATLPPTGPQWSGPGPQVVSRDRNGRADKSRCLKDRFAAQ